MALFEGIATLFGLLATDQRGIKDPRTGKIALEFDAIINETPEYTAVPTEFEVEAGADVSDHVKLSPEKLTIDAVISNTPVTLERALIGSAIGLATSFVPAGPLAAAAATGLGSVAGLLQDSSDPAKEAFNFLKELYTNREPFDIVTGLQSYTSHIITSIAIERNKSTANELAVTLSTQKIVVVSSLLVVVPAFKVAEDVKASASSSQKLGKQGTKGASESGERKSSLLLSGLQSVGVF